MIVCRHRRVAMLAVVLMFIFSSSALAAQTRGKPQKNTNAAQSKSKAQTNAAKPKPQTTAAKSKAPSSAGATLFVVAQDRNSSHIEPLVGIIEGRYLEPPSAESEQFAAFASRYYHAGQKYRLLFGGGDAGTATVRARPDKDSDCARALAGVELQTGARINGLVMGLATNSETLGRRATARRFPTPAERTTVNMTATDLNGDGKWEIVASFIVHTRSRTEAVHHLFIIALAEDDGFDVDLMRYARTTKGDLPEGASLDDVDEALLSEVLVDHVDLDGDKVSEVVTMTTNFEGATYKIYRKQKNQWANVYEYYSYRCAY
jgi:hypothetical protein